MKHRRNPSSFIKLTSPINQYGAGLSIIYVIPDWIEFSFLTETI
ncbi:MAG: hypothetical protein ABI237_02445 [Ginsengibacter sp.]